MTSHWSRVIGRFVIAMIRSPRGTRLPTAPTIHPSIVARGSIVGSLGSVGIVIARLDELVGLAVPSIGSTTTPIGSTPTRYRSGGGLVHWIAPVIDRLAT